MPEDKPSKTQLKREMHQLQALGERLILLSPQQLAEMPLPDPLREAVDLARNMNKKGALYRQKQYIGKLMRGIDSEPIKTSLERLQSKEKEQISIFKEAEQWRDRILNDGDSAIQQFIQEYPDSDRQRMRQWLRDSHREQQNQKPPRSARELFRYVHKALNDAR